MDMHIPAWEQTMLKNTLDNLSQREAIRYLKQCCKDGLHAWGPSASPEYEKCTRSWCETVRKKEQEKNGK